MTKTKQIRLRPNIDQHDLDTKLKQAKKFIEKGKQVKFQMRFKGREITHAEIGQKVMDDVLESMGDVIVNKYPVLKGNMILMSVAPKEEK